MQFEASGWETEAGRTRLVATMSHHIVRYLLGQRKTITSVCYISVIVMQMDCVHAKLVVVITHAAALLLPMMLIGGKILTLLHNCFQTR